MLFEGGLKNTLIGGVFLFIIYAILKGIYNVYFHPLSKFPGPKSFAASSLPLAITVASGALPFKIKELHEKYGDVIRIAPDEITICSAAALHDTLSRPGLPKHPKFYPLPPNGIPSILTARNNADHSRYRRLLSHAFSEKALREQESLINDYINLFISKLYENADKPQDMVAWYNFVSFDIIGDLTLGESFNCLRDAELHPWVSLLFKYFKASCFMGISAHFPWLKAAILPLIIPKSLIKSRMQHSVFTREKVVARIESETDRPDFMSNILRHNDKETGMTEDEIVSTFGILLIAGSETTATLLSAVTFYLLMNQEVLAKLTDEIRSSFKTEEEITMVSVNKLKYELAVLDEAMRIHPPAPLGSVRVTPPEGATISGVWVPGGTTVSLALYSTHRQKSNWRDPDSFVPERWLNDPKYKSDNRASFAPFSLGSRNCIGRNLAYSEMRVIIARLLWNFDLKLEEESRRWIDMKVFILWEKPPLMVKLTPAVR